jgi:hypothetical protein
LAVVGELGEVADRDGGVGEGGDELELAAERFDVAAQR